MMISPEPLVGLLSNLPNTFLRMSAILKSTINSVKIMMTS